MASQAVWSASNGVWRASQKGDAEIENKNSFSELLTDYCLSAPKNIQKGQLNCHLCNPGGIIRAPRDPTVGQ